MPGAERRTFGLHLAWLLSFAVTNVFVTALIATTGDLATLWPLYIVSIVIASLGYHVAGAVLSMAITVASVALLSYAIGSDFSSFSELLTGLAAYAVAAIVIGVQAQRSSEHGGAAEADTARDPGTGALTRTHLDRQLDLELRRAKRYGWETSLVLVRVTDFREFRHKFGRIRAEQMLVRLAQVLHLTVRETDLVGRWENDSFGIVLQLTESEEASDAAARILSAVESTEFEGDALEPVTHCRVEAGFATFPGEGHDQETLVTSAIARLGETPPEESA